MITNQRQYEITQHWIDRFEIGKAKLPKEALQLGLEPLAIKVIFDAMDCQILDLRDQLAEYDHLRTSKEQSWQISSLDQLGIALIKARIMARFDEQALANQLGWTEEAVSNFERQEYQDASLNELTAVAKILEVEIRIRLDKAA
jgi:HTH-type transcriptional regulator / antitoxin HipB